MGFELRPDFLHANPRHALERWKNKAATHQHRAGENHLLVFYAGRQNDFVRIHALGWNRLPEGCGAHPGGKYLWPIYDSYDIFIADRKGKIVKQLTNTPGYDAEATVSPKGDKIVFTSTRNGDLDLYTMDINGKT